MKKLIAIMVFFCSLEISGAQAQTLRSTTFDARPICEENKGIWREFGNGCANKCEEQFDEYAICTQALVYSCDCGKGRCWHENKCMPLSQYKIIFDKESEETKKFLEKKEQERKDRIAKDPNLRIYLQNLYANKGTAPSQQAVNQATDQQMSAQQVQAVQPVASIPSTPQQPAPNAIMQQAVKYNLPPAYLAQQEANAKNAALATQNSTPQANSGLQLPQIQPPKQ